MKDVQYIECPFCGEKDFDLIGLKYHLVIGYCHIFNDTNSFNLSEVTSKELEGLPEE